MLLLSGGTLWYKSGELDVDSVCLLMSLRLPEGLNWWVYKMSEDFQQDYMITDHSAGDAPGTPEPLLAYSCPSLNILSSFSFLVLFRTQHVSFCSEPLKY